MLKPVARANRGGSALAWGGGAAILVAVLQFLQQELPEFNLKKWPLWVISGAILLAGLTIAQVGNLRARRQAAQDLDEVLDGALACWPPQFASALSPYDVGVRPALRAEPGPPPYMKRDADGDLAGALDGSDIVVVFGPAGAGKSRSAFAAVPERTIMLVPEHAEGLATLLRVWPSLRLADDDAVLWLDGFERYAAGVDVDPIMAFLRRPPAAGRLRRMRRQLGRGGEERAASTKLVATIRDDALERLLGGDEPEGYPVRRLMAGAHGVFLAGELSDAEKATFAGQFKSPPASDSVPEAFSSVWRSGWRSAATFSSDGTPWARKQWDMSLTVLGVALAVAVIWLLTQWNELTVPPPIDQQVAKLVDEANCPVDAFPSKGDGIKDDGTTNADVLVAIEHGGDCGASDEVRFYRRRGGKLRDLAALAPDPSMTRQTFACLGPVAKGTSPCHVTVRGNKRLIVGAFEDAQTHQELPVAISFEEGGLRVWPLTLPKSPLPGVPPSIRKLDRRLVELRLRVGTSDSGTDDGPCGESPSCSRGLPAQATAVLPPEGRRPALLIAGYTTRGTTDSPDTILVRMWNLTLENGQPTADRDCIVLRDGRVENVEIEHSDGALLKGWLPKGSQVMC